MRIIWVKKRWESTNEECHCEGVQNEDEEEFEKVGCVVCKASHPVGSSIVYHKYHNRKRKIGTYIEETMIVGSTRKGTTSNIKRERSQAVGL